MSSNIASRRRRRCTMIRATILLCYLFTCCTHPTYLTAIEARETSQDTQRIISQHPNAASSSEELSSFVLSSSNNKNVNGNGNKWKEEIRIEDLKHDNVHKLMSEQDLRRTFQVDSHDQVPEYEILKLTVNDDGSHLISPISDLGELTTTTTEITTNTILKDDAFLSNSETSTTMDAKAAAAAVESSVAHVRQKRSSSSLELNVLKNEDHTSCSGNCGSNTNEVRQEQTHRKLNSERRELIDNNQVDQNSKLKYHQQTKLEEREQNQRAKQQQTQQLSRDIPADAKATISNNDDVQDKNGNKSTGTASAKGSNNIIGTRTRADGQESPREANKNEDESEKLIVMKLSTFGRDFKLRLKRNVDFQQRIKDMKMFMAESTKDGQLRYTEIKSNHQQHKQQQDQHKRAVTTTTSEDAEERAAGDSPTSNIESSSSSSSITKTTANGAKQEKNGELPKEGSEYKGHISSSSAGNVWNIGSTYHDEDNLAALLIDHDRKTGQLQVDGTIGNDFVIKPMPQATIDTLLLKRRQQELLRRQQQQVVEASAVAAEQLQSTSRLDRLKPASNNAVGVESVANVDIERKSGVDKGTYNLDSAIHMYDDDPHDDDEMFLDEDEAIELAHLQSSTFINSNQTRSETAANQPSNGIRQVINTGAPTTAAKQQTENSSLHQQQLPQQQPRALSKAASERKWKKYRKLMAQTQVPKPNALEYRDDLLTQQNSQQQQASSSHKSSTRARRHAHVDTTGEEEMETEAEEPRQVQVSHHIVYRQRPSSEASSNEHQHSFMISPSQQYNSPSLASMEQLAISFSSPKRLTKRSALSNYDENEELDGDDNDNMIDNQNGAGRLARHTTKATRYNEDQGTEYSHDPMDSQFYLEPGTVTGIERAGYNDWSLISGHRRSMAPPPYVLNGSVSGGKHQQSVHEYDRGLNDTNSYANGTDGSNVRRRYKRHVGQRIGGPMQAGSQVRRKRQAPDTVWPEVLLVVDYDSFLLHGGDSRDVKRYFVSFWNGVDLRYKLLVHPHIRISLAGMIVAKDRDATPYLERNRLRAPNADAVDAAGALTDMGKYLYREDRLPTYDLAVVITKLDMCRRRYEGGRCNRGTAGFAYVGGACVVNKRLEKVNSVAIIEDSGGFSGIIVAAHEVGHLLGCVHDGSPPPSYLGGPGATHCPWEDGFIMSDLRHTERGFRWSQCSVEQFKHFLNGETATCLYNYPHESQMLHRLLPGTMLSLDEQCKRDRGTNACFKDARVCAQLFCFDSASGYCVSYRPAAEGSPCGEGQVCRNGKCVGEIENIIPDYTHQTQTVVARRPSHSVSRLTADNGLSASSTSTATSSPDSKLLPVAATQQLTSRMDTFPIDTPLAGPTSNGYHNFGGRYNNAVDKGTTNGVMLMRQASSPVNAAITVSTSLSSGLNHHNLQLSKSAKLIEHNKQGYQQRSGYQAIPKDANQSVVSKQNSNNNNYHAHSSTALYTSASTNTMSHQYPSNTGGNNNLLTSIPASSVTRAKRQPDNQRIMYQPIKQQESQYQNSNNNHNHQHNHVNKIVSSSY